MIEIHSPAARPADRSSFYDVVIICFDVFTHAYVTHPLNLNFEMRVGRGWGKVVQRFGAVAQIYHIV